MCLLPLVHPDVVLVGEGRLLLVERQQLPEFIHCKKELAIFPSPAGMSLIKLSLGGKKLNYSRPGRV